MPPFDLAMLLAIMVSTILLGFGAVALGTVLTGQTDLSDLIMETNEHGIRKPSLSRLQFLVSSFVIVGLYLIICLESGTFVDVPPGVIMLLGISSGSYLISKGLNKSSRRPGVKPQQSVRDPNVRP